MGAKSDRLLDGVHVMAPSGGGHYNHARASRGLNSMKWLLPKMRDLVPLTWALVAMIAPVAAQQITVERDTPLYSEARLDSTVVTALKQGTQGEVVGKTGAWLNLKTAEATGWLFSFNVRFASAQPASEASSASGLGRLFGPRQRVNVTSTIGIRGLEEENLRQARFDAGQMRLLDQYAVSRAEAEKRARESGLSAARIDYLDGQPQ